MTLQQARETSAGVADLIDRILDKGLVINADIKVAVVGFELLDIKIRATLASFETAARYGLEFPSGTSLETRAWQEALLAKETCPHCAKRVPVEELMGDGCPWCGWLSAKSKRVGVVSSLNGHRHGEIPQAQAR